MSETPDFSPGAVRASGSLRLNSTELHELVGAITVRGAEIDMALVTLFVLLSTPDGGDAHVGKLLSAGMEFTWLAERCQDLAKLLHTDKPWKEDLVQAVGAAKTVMAYRNRVVHATWWERIGGGIYGTTMKKYRATETFPVDAETLRTWWVEMNQAWLGLIASVYAITGHQFPEPEDDVARSS
ncbi:MAG: hypothetical protein QOJ11_563 [Frankiales bacterium]|jgi:hypothetical protein|nr:hypothetical protein [Frankiales bacterium]